MRMVLFELAEEIETLAAEAETTSAYPGIAGIPAGAIDSNFDANLALVNDIFGSFFFFLSNNYIIPGVSLLNFILGGLFVIFFLGFILLGYLDKHGWR